MNILKFFRLQKWNFEEVPMDDIYKRISDLEIKMEKILKSVEKLEEENIETTNILYEHMNSISGLDRRIDILNDEKF